MQPHPLFFSNEPSDALAKAGRSTTAKAGMRRAVSHKRHGLGQESLGVLGRVPSSGNFMLPAQPAGKGAAAAPDLHVGMKSLQHAGRSLMRTPTEPITSLGARQRTPATSPKSQPGLGVSQTSTLPRLTPNSASGSREGGGWKSTTLGARAASPTGPSASRWASTPSMPSPDHRRMQSSDLRLAGMLEMSEQDSRRPLLAATLSAIRAESSEPRSRAPDVAEEVMSPSRAPASAPSRSSVVKPEGPPPRMMPDGSSKPGTSQSATRFEQTVGRTASWNKFRRMGSIFGRVPTEKLDGRLSIGTTDSGPTFGKEASIGPEAVNRTRSLGANKRLSMVQMLTGVTKTQSTKRRSSEVDGTPLSHWGAAKAEVLEKLKTAPKARQTSLKAKVDLYDHLEKEGMEPGYAALAAALEFRVGSLKKAFKYMDFNRNGEISFMEFSGSMSMMGLDLKVLCGRECQEVFNAIDVAPTDGSIVLPELLNLANIQDLPPMQREASHKARPQSDKGAPPSRSLRALVAAGHWRHNVRSRHQDEDDCVQKQVSDAGKKWDVVAKWMAAASMHQAAVKEQRLASGWSLPAGSCRSSAAGEPSEGDQAESSGVATTVGDASLRGAGGSLGSSGGEDFSAVEAGAEGAGALASEAEGAVPGMDGGGAVAADDDGHGVANVAADDVGAGGGRDQADLGIAAHSASATASESTTRATVAATTSVLDSPSPAAGGAGSGGAAGGVAQGSRVGIATDGAGGEANVPPDAFGSGGAPGADAGSVPASAEVDSSPTARGAPSPTGSLPNVDAARVPRSPSVVAGGGASRSAHGQDFAAPTPSKGSRSEERPESKRGSFVNPRISVEERAAEAAEDMAEQDGPLQMVFNATASIRARDGIKLMNRPDLHRFFKDLEHVDPCGRHRVSPKVLDRLYDEAIELQRDFRGLSKGLSFWSFKVLLNNVIKELGLGWYGLVEIAVGRKDQAAAGGDKVSSSAFESYAKEKDQGRKAKSTTPVPLLTPSAGKSFYAS